MSNIVKQPCDEAVIEALACTTPCKKAMGKWILAATILGSSMVFVDGTVVNVALPILQSELSATVTHVQWIVEIYALMLAALLLVGGSLGDRYGRRLIFSIGVVVFAIASAWCGYAPTVGQLIIARAVQGIGGALLVPGSLAIISVSFKEEERGKAIGTWSAFTAITMAIGPVLGGWLIENVSWRWIFYINIPLAVVVISILCICVPESRDTEKTSGLDWIGATTITLGFGALVYGLIESANLGLTHPIVITSVFSGVLLIIGFIVSQSRVKSPMMPLNLFKSVTFSGANLLTFFLYSALGAELFFFPFNLIQIQGYSATEAGAAFIPLVLIIFLLSHWAGGLIKKYGAKFPLVIGSLIVAIGYVLFAIPGIGGSYWTTFFPGVTVLGLGMAICIAPLSTTVMGSVPVRNSGIASGINNAVSRIAALLAIAIFGILVYVIFNKNLDSQLTALNIPSETLKAFAPERIKLAAAAVPSSISLITALAFKQAIAMAFVKSFRFISFISAFLALISALFAWLMIGQ